MPYMQKSSNYILTQIKFLRSSLNSPKSGFNFKELLSGKARQGGVELAWLFLKILGQGMAGKKNTYFEAKANIKFSLIMPGEE